MQPDILGSHRDSPVVFQAVSAQRSSHPSRRRPAPVTTPALRRLLEVVLLLFGLLAINSLYLLSVSVAERLSGQVYQNYAYLLMFLGHLVLGLVLIVPALLFGALHLRRAWRRRNRNAVRAGIALYVSAILLLLSGLLLTRFGFFEINDPLVRRPAYWVHVLTPLLVVWLFVLHRLAGPPLRWQRGIRWGVVAVAFAALGLGLHLWNADSRAGEAQRPFLPARVQLEGTGTIPTSHLQGDEQCGGCHADILQQHAGSMHRFSSFNNPAYRFSVNEARQVLLQRDGSVEVAQLCAGCHDPLPLLSGAFARPDYDPQGDPASRAGITCLVCHAIDAVGSPRGNGDYRISDPPRYPFAFSDNAALQAINHQLIKAKPEFHKETLLKPLHRRAEFCSVCHKVHLPRALNHYRWLRGQDHYDSFLLSGVSGHRVDSFYYPPKAKRNCAACHMPPLPSDDPAARDFTANGRRSVHDHFFAAANTGVATLVGRPPRENDRRRHMLAKAARVDIFGLREDGRVDGTLHAPLRPRLPALQPGKRYLIETVVRTLGVGHKLTQGTADSNELWLDVRVRNGDRLIGRSGALDERGDVDPWAYFLNAYLLDRNGNRIERRNAQDIFVTLYDHQIPPGAASVIHYAFTVPADASGYLDIDLRLNYRKFDSRFLSHVEGEGFRANELPITTLASDHIRLPVAGASEPAGQDSPVAAWERWNDYGIGLLREGNSGVNRGELRPAAEAFRKVEQLGHADGALNLARVYYKEGRLQDAAQALRRAAAMDPPAPPWTLAWLSALVERELGNLDAAIDTLEALADTRFAAARERGFDFGRDYRMLNELGRTLFERARRERGSTRRAERNALLHKAAAVFDRVLSEDPENATAHYNLALIYEQLGRQQDAARERRLHERYRRDEHAVERAVALHRSRNPAADHAAEPVAVYDLQRRPLATEEDSDAPVEALAHETDGAAT